MKEYIERGELLKELERFPHLKTAESVVRSMPKADVVEARHGFWIEDGDEELPCVCSLCGSEAQYTSTFEEKFEYDWDENLQPVGYEEYREYIKTDYCPNCGAKMDGERKEQK